WVVVGSNQPEALAESGRKSGLAVVSLGKATSADGLRVTTPTEHLHWSRVELDTAYEGAIPAIMEG
ncbi:MAG: hypothetical protein ACOYON_08605, partial [Fimbriimonas sp.]